MKHCSLTPPFPKKAFVVSLFFSGGKELNIITMPRIQFALAEIQKDVQKINSGLKDNSDTKRVMLYDSCAVIPITLSSKLLLTYDLWKNPTLDYTESDRQQAFLPAIDSPQLYQLMVVGEHYIEATNTWLFGATIPFLLTTPKEAIMQFMVRSKAIVDDRAKYAALYDFGKPFRFNWKTGRKTSLLTPAPMRKRISN